MRSRLAVMMPVLAAGVAVLGFGNPPVRGEKTAGTFQDPSPRELVRMLAGAKRNTALEKLIAMGAPAMAPLVEALENPRFEDRGYAAYALGAVLSGMLRDARDEKALRALVKCLEEDGRVGIYAGTGLMVVDDRRVILALLRNHNPKHGDMKVAVWSLTGRSFSSREEGLQWWDEHASEYPPQILPDEKDEKEVRQAQRRKAGPQPPAAPATGKHPDGCPAKCDTCKKAAAKGLAFLEANIGDFLGKKADAPYEGPHIAALAGLAFLAAGASDRKKKLEEITDYLATYVTGSHKQPEGQCTWNLAFIGLYFAELRARSEKAEPKQRKFLEDVADKIIAILGRVQTGEGGWGHAMSSLPSPDYPETLTSCTAWCAATLGVLKRLGRNVDQAVPERAVRFLLDQQLGNGGFVYGPSRTDPDRGRTSSVTFALMMCGASSTPAFARAMRYIRGDPPRIAEGYTTSSMHLLYAALLLHAQGGENWKLFRQEFRDRIIRGQQEAGHFACICGRGRACIDHDENIEWQFWNLGEKVVARRKLQVKMYVTAIYCTILQVDGVTMSRTAK